MKRNDLEKLIKENNLWEDLSDLSYIQISNLLKNDFFSVEFKEKLFDYLKQDKIYRLYMNKK